MKGRPVEGPPAVAIQGCPGSFSHDAAERAFGPGVRILECGTFAEAVEALTGGRAGRLVLPVENTILGPIPGVRRLLSGAPLRETGVIDLDVRHCLVVRSTAAASSIRRVASHPAALEQCRGFLDARPGWSAVPVDDTAGAVRDLAAGRLPAEAAIASARAARMYGCRILLGGIQDDSRNVTHFAVLEKDEDGASSATRRVRPAALAAARPPARTAPGPCSPAAPPR